MLSQAHPESGERRAVCVRAAAAAALETFGAGTDCHRELSLSSGVTQESTRFSVYRWGRGRFAARFSVYSCIFLVVWLPWLLGY